MRLFKRPNEHGDDDGDDDDDGPESETSNELIKFFKMLNAKVRPKADAVAESFVYPSVELSFAPREERLQGSME